ncbi:MAG: penicillin acylase family protein [Wenzhouxiangella sp.]|jgi:penicillin amidase|nr:penicillin acylase family protein [Wenzhouxiangella sp.]
MASPTRKILFRSFWVSLLGVVILMVGAWFGGRLWIAQSQMPYEGEIRLPGLSAPVEVLFDGRGIPRIYAQTDRDVMTALGWLHAGERLFQMELIRRMATGELAALFGPVALELDVLNRGFGFARRVADNPPELDPETAGLIDAYLLGINGRIQSADQLPPEFLILGHEPRPWTQADVLSIAYYQSFFPLTLVQQIRDAYLTITEHFGPEANEWLRSLSDEAITTLPTLRITKASNTWVVAPERSESGAALHASDPHLEFNTAPGLWYAAGLHSQQSIDALGVTAPGLPFIAMGHNGQIAWAFTVAPVDLFELYRLERDPAEPNRLMGPDGWTSLHTHSEEILVRGQETPHQQSYQYTAFGKVLESTDTDVLVLRWAGFELPIEPLVRQGLAINRSENFNQFRRAASDMGALSVNWSYSDRDGNIGYVQSTPVPVREHEDFFQVLDGVDPRYQWRGFHPPENRPYALNPDRGWLANANNLAAGPDWPYAIPGFYYQDRIRRATDLLESQPVFNQADMTRFQLDLVSDRALAWKDWLADTAERTGRRIIAEDLRNWNGQMRADSDVAGLFARWWGYLPRALFHSSERNDARPDWQALRPVTDRWLRDAKRPAGLAVRNLEQAAEIALEDALKAGARPLGLIQTLEIQHPMAQSDLLNSWLKLSRGPFALGGDSASLNAAFSRFDTGSASWEARSGASMRFVMDWADPDAFTLNLAMGQSGHSLSPHFDSFLGDFLTGEPWRVPWTRAEIERSAVSSQALVPDR